MFSHDSNEMLLEYRLQIAASRHHTEHVCHCELEHDEHYSEISCEEKGSGVVNVHWRVDINRLVGWFGLF